MTQFCWYTERINQGQIVEEMDAQICGAAEGSQGPAKGLSLRYDRSDRSWTIYKGKRGIARGKGQNYPTVEEAMTLLAKHGH